MGKKIGKYELGATLGSGAFSKVKVGIDSETGQKWAVKIIDKEQLAREHMEEQLKREIAILKSLNHPNIVHLREVMQTANHIYMVLEVVQGGELFDKIVAAKRLDEDTGRRYFHQLIGAVMYCHAQGIAHRDIKPENLLLDANDDLKISDFGLSNLQPTNRAALLQTVCGTPNYVAPEVLREKGYDGFKADVWSCGIVLFVMIAGYLPFDDSNQNALFNKIERGDFRMARHFSEPLKDLIAKMLVVDPAKRLSIEQIIQHPWFAVGYKQAVSSRDQLKPTDDEIAGAIREETAEVETAAPAKAAAQAAAPSAAAGGSNTIDAFDIVARFTGTSLSTIAVQQASSDIPANRRASLMLVQGDVGDVVSAFQTLSCNIKSAPGASEVKGFINCSQGLITFVVVVQATTVPGLSLVEVKRGRGDIMEYRNLIVQLMDTLGPKLKSVPMQTAEDLQ